jgi:hypothetical protein
LQLRKYKDSIISTILEKILGWPMGVRGHPNGTKLCYNQSSNKNVDHNKNLKIFKIR